MQIKANELRIGNLFNYDPKIKNCPIKATPIDIDDIKLCQEEQWEWHHFYTCIPLTEEWLLKFGFEKSKHFESFILSLNEWAGIHVHLYKEKCAVEISISKHSITTETYYIHQLQNLYFSLTGKELEICK